MTGRTAETEKDGDQENSNPEKKEIRTYFSKKTKPTAGTKPGRRRE